MVRFENVGLRYSLGPEVLRDVSFELAAQSYQNNPTALHLRAMNMLYEGLKEKGALMLIPSSAVESIGMGGLMGAAALRQQTLTGTTPTGTPTE